MTETDQLKATDEPISPRDIWAVGLNRWQYLVVLSLAWLVPKFWPSRLDMVFGLLFMSVIVAVLLATLSRLRNIGRPVFGFANWTYAIAALIVLFIFLGKVPRWHGVSFAAVVLVFLLPCIFLPPRYEIHRQMDLPGYLLITLLMLLAGGFTFWCYRY